MKKLIPLFILLIAIISCSKESEENFNNPIIGSWKLTEILSDPGDGSGTYNPIESNKLLTFNVNGSVISNGSLCTMSIETGTWDSGTWSLNDSSIIISDCFDSQLMIYFKLEGKTLELFYPCIEACGMKFIKMANY